MKLLIQALFVGAAFMFLVAFTTSGFAHPSYFTNNCAGCHKNDTATCNGCHHHGAVNLTAVADKTQYQCDESAAVTLSGGSKSGWIRAILYNQDGLEIARATGPTHTGDDSGADAVAFPVVLIANAPVGKGVYVWQAAWWGSPYDTGNPTVNPHGPEVRVPVEINVVGPSPVEDSTWSRIKQLFRATAAIPAAQAVE
jgi:hypothetical protein